MFPDSKVAAIRILTESALDAAAGNRHRLSLIMRGDEGLRFNTGNIGGIGARYPT